MMHYGADIDYSHMYSWPTLSITSSTKAQNIKLNDIRETIQETTAF